MSQKLQSSYKFAKEPIKELEQLSADLAKSQELLAAALLEIKQLDRLRELHFESHTKDLAEREAEIVNLRRVLNYYANGNPALGTLNEAAKALSTPQSTPYLEQWGKDRYWEPVSIKEPDYHYEAMGCGLEDRNITDRYDAMRHGWDCAVERIFEQIPDGTLYARKEQ